MNKKQKFGDVVENHELVKRTLMVAAFPALIKKVERKGVESFEGFLPGFEFAEVKDIETEEELVEVLQDMLDDEVEELIVFGKSLPYVDEDEVLLEKYPDNKIVYLDINVYASKEDLEGCSHDCSCCEHGCDCDDEDYEDCDCCEDDYEENCSCGCHEHCDCDDDCDDTCDCGCHEHYEHCDCEHEHHKCTCSDGCDENCSCGCHDGKNKCDETCDCGCQEGKPCTCGDDCDCGCHGKDKKDKNKK